MTYPKNMKMIPTMMPGMMHRSRPIPNRIPKIITPYPSAAARSTHCHSRRTLPQVVSILRQPMACRRRSTSGRTPKAGTTAASSGRRNDSRSSISRCAAGLSKPSATAVT